VQAGSDALPLQWLFLLEAPADAGEHRHIAVGPLDPAPTLGRQPEVLDVLRRRARDARRLPVLPHSLLSALLPARSGPSGGRV
jgi:hypothetical protein